MDLVRAMAIGLVLVAHGRGFLPRFPGRPVLWTGGYYGVELFFVLSGFLIGAILIRDFDHPRTSGFHVIGRFWIRRWFRTIPNYLLFLLLNLTVFGWFFGARPFSGLYLVFLQNFAWPCPAFMPESWSLAVEEWFYLSLPIAALVCLSLPLSKRRALLVSFCTYVLLFLTLRSLAAWIRNPGWDEGIRKVVVYRLDAIGYGVLVAYFSHFHGEQLRRARVALMALGAVLVVWSVAVTASARPPTLESFLNKTLLFAGTNIGFALMLPFLREIRGGNRHLVRCVAHVSIASYSMYLVHFSFVRPLVAMAVVRGLPSSLAFATYCGATIALGTLVYRWYERPMTRLRDRWSGGISLSKAPTTACS